MFVGIRYFFFLVLFGVLIFILFNVQVSSGLIGFLLVRSSGLCPDPCLHLNISMHTITGVPRGVNVVLVTGGAGFIGSNLVDKLLSLGYYVRVLDNLATGDIRYLPLDNPRLDVIFGSIVNYDLVYRVMTTPLVLNSSEYFISGIFHLAAMSKVGPSLKDPSVVDLCIASNVQGTANVLRAATTARNDGLINDKVKLVYAGSSTYYGNQKVPFNERDLFSPSSTYAASKYQGELLVKTWDNLYNLPTTTLRFFMVWGPRQPRTGAYAIVTGVFADQIDKGQPLTIEGDGSHFRVATALILALQSDIRNTDSINIGTGKAVTVREIANLISTDQVRLPERVHDLVGTCADTCRAKQVLKFVARHDIFTELQAFLRENRNKHTNSNSMTAMSRFWEEIELGSLDVNSYFYNKSSAILLKRAKSVVYISRNGTCQLCQSSKVWEF